ncbi:MAG: DUF6130 family protein, partial [Flavobacteriaceae bacterium]|nr:DUF6130 family protein [Flavobacteriaceae bacterium]
MKKIYVLLLSLTITTLSFGQELLLNGGFEAWDDATTPTSYSKAENTEQETVEFHDGATSAKHTGGTKDIAQTVTGIVPGASYTISLWYKVESGDGSDARIWCNWKAPSGNLTDNEDVLKGPNNSYLPTNNNAWTQYTTTITAPATADAFYFEVRTYSGAIVYYDDFSVFKESVASPSLSILSPGNGNWIEGQDVDVTLSVQNFDVADGTADGHIHYSVDGGDAVMKYDTDPIALTGLSFGSHSITVELVDNSHAALATPVTAISTFNTYQTQTLPIIEDFEYPDGSLSDIPSWNSFSGTPGDLLVSSGQAVIQHGTPSEDVNITFGSGTGDVFYALDFTVVDPGGIITGDDFEYFVVLKDDDFNYRARLDVAEALNGGDFTIGISTEASTADEVWATDLSYGTTYRATVRFNQESNTSELWIDATASTDTSILGLDGTDPGTTVTQFALRQSDSSLNESILIDNLTISQTFNETLSSNNFSAATDFNLYPNPTKSDFVNITSTGSGAMQAAIFDILGKQVINTTVSNKRINISTLNTGIYIVKLT